MSRRGRSRQRGTRSVELKIASDTDLKRLYKVYYRLDPPMILPADLNRREFAFHPWDSTSYVRHLSFNTEKELRAYLAANAPLHAYHSIAFYELPEAPKMEEKGFLGAELLFDIDADHLPECNGSLDDHCLRLAAKEASKLVRILKRDLGAETFTYYTGNRGFHVRAWCDYCLTLGREERRAIASYVRCDGLEFDIIFPNPHKLGRQAIPAVPTPRDPGLRGWIGSGFRDSIKLSGGSRPEETLGRRWLDELQALLADVCVEIDAQVTQDTSRLTRIPGTLNGKASLIVAYLVEPSEFKPSDTLTPFKGEVEIEAKQDLEATILGVDLKLKKGSREVLPAGVALSLVSRGIASIVSGEVVVRADTGWRPLQDVRWPPRTS